MHPFHKSRIGIARPSMRRGTTPFRGFSIASAQSRIGFRADLICSLGHSAEDRNKQPGGICENAGQLFPGKSWWDGGNDQAIKHANQSTGCTGVSTMICSFIVIDFINWLVFLKPQSEWQIHLHGDIPPRVQRIAFIGVEEIPVIFIQQIVYTEIYPARLTTGFVWQIETREHIDQCVVIG